MSLPLAGRLVLGIGLGAGLAYTATPLAVAAARRLAFFDYPLEHKGHVTPTPYLGGVALILAYALALIAGAGDAARTLPLLGGVAVLVVVGTIDDRRTVSPPARVAVEFVLGLLLTAAGLAWHLGAGAALDALVNGIWVVGVINAFNLFDNMDGAASTMALVVAGGACGLALVHDNRWAVAASAALCGACLGFLPYNMSRPARIFLGDGGSMPLGLAIAVLVVDSARGAERSMLALITGLLLIGLPALDTTLVIISRRRRGISILTGGQDHLTHRTRLRVRTAHRVVLVLGATQALISALVIAGTRGGATTLGYLLIAFVVCAGLTILALERAVGPTPDSTSTLPGPRAVGLNSTPAAPWFTRIPPVAVVVLGVGVGASSFFAGYYDAGVWIPIGFVVVIAVSVGMVIRPPAVTLPMVLIAAGAAGLGLLSLLSSLWASSAESAMTYANRWLAYAALILLIALLIRRRRDAQLLLIAIGIGIAVVAASVTVRLLGSAPWDLFIGGRLNSPLGYVNGQGCVFAMGVWFALALAERREPWLAGMGSAAVVVCGSLTLLSQSRGTAIASFVAVVVALLVFPGRRRRLFALTVVLVGLVAAAGAQFNVYHASKGSAVPTAAAHHAAYVMLAAAAVTGLVWAGLVAFAQAHYERSPTRRRGLERTAATLAVVIVLVPVLAAVVNAGKIERTLRTQWHAFTHLSDQSSNAAADSSQTRLLTGAGNRYDYWRIAWKVFSSHPVGGVGAGNYTASYYRYRATQEAIENPHSIELQTLSELGLAGGLVLLVFLGGIGLGMWRLSAAARGSLSARTVLVAAGGTFVVWFVDTSGDWMHLLPGVAAVALAAIAIFAVQLSAARGDAAEQAGGDASGAARGRGGLPRVWQPRVLFGGAVVGLLLTVAGGNLLRQGLAQHYLRSARGELRANPAAAITDAVRALRLDGADLDAYYVKAAGQARFDRADAAQQTLMVAAHEDPQAFVTWVLLGDLEVRRRNYSAARTFYSHAHALDPNDPSLAQLAADPVRARNPQ